jgi:hypothetical protein
MLAAKILLHYSGLRMISKWLTQENYIVFGNDVLSAIIRKPKVNLLIIRIVLK